MAGGSSYGRADAGILSCGEKAELRGGRWWTGGDARRSTILRLYFCRLACVFFARNPEIDAMIVIGFLGGGEIEVGERDLVGTSVGEVEEGPADDGVILHLGLAAVLEDEHGGGLRGDDRLGRLVRHFRSGGLGSGIAGRMPRRRGIMVPGAAIVNRGHTTPVSGVDVDRVVFGGFGLSVNGVGHGVRNIPGRAQANGKALVIARVVIPEGLVPEVVRMVGETKGKTAIETIAEAVGSERGDAGGYARCRVVVSPKAKGSDGGGSTVNLGVRESSQQYCQ